MHALGTMHHKLQTELRPTRPSGLPPQSGPSRMLWMVGFSAKRMSSKPARLPLERHAQDAATMSSIMPAAGSGRTTAPPSVCAPSARTMYGPMTSCATARITCGSSPCSTSRTRPPARAWRFVSAAGVIRPVSSMCRPIGSSPSARCEPPFRSARRPLSRCRHPRRSFRASALRVGRCGGSARAGSRPTNARSCHLFGFYALVLWLILCRP